MSVSNRLQKETKSHTKLEAMLTESNLRVTKIILSPYTHHISTVSFFILKIQDVQEALDIYVGVILIYVGVILIYMGVCACMYSHNLLTLDLAVTLNIQPFKRHLNTCSTERTFNFPTRKTILQI